MKFHLLSYSVFAFSDTHGSHRLLQVPENVDIVICAGDAVEDDLKGGVYEDFIEWFSSLSARWKIFVPGNHELSFGVGQAEKIVRQMNEKGIIVLEDAVEDCDGVLIASISGNATIVDEDMGSVNILNFIMKAKPSYHLFGHIHSTAGQSQKFGCTECINIAVPPQVP